MKPAIYQIDGKFYRLDVSSLVALEGIHKALGVSRQAVHGWVTGKARPSQQNAEALHEIAPGMFKGLE